MTETDLHIKKPAAVLRINWAGCGLKRGEQLGVTAVISVGDDGGVSSGEEGGEIRFH